MLDKAMLAAYVWYKKNVCSEHLLMPHPNHNCPNRAP